MKATVRNRKVVFAGMLAGLMLSSGCVSVDLGKLMSKDLREIVVEEGRGWSRDKVAFGRAGTLLDLCRIFAHPTPAEADPQENRFALRRARPSMVAAKASPMCGKKDFFGWE
ncbi:MAG: hypothetical protein U1F77_15055 [Kiritimatiellia bacterium]